MARKPTWQNTAAKATVEAIANDMATAFNIPTPRVFIPDHYSGRDWHWGFDTVEVWTFAGRAEMNVYISATFAHMYFRFSDPKRAIPFDDACGRLNRHSGKWNSLASPPDDLEAWRAMLNRDFRKVAQPNPDPVEVAAYRAKESAEAAQWAQWRAEFAAECAARNQAESHQ